MRVLRYVPVAGLFLFHVAAVMVSKQKMAELLEGDGVELARLAQPMWFFGQAVGRPPCYPTFATDDNGRQTQFAVLCRYPNVGCDCRKPDVEIGNEGPSFPVYFSFRQCNETDVRIAYNLFYEKDGFLPDGINGHPYDWERVIVVWAQRKSIWVPSKLLLSQHQGYEAIDWADIANTFRSSDAKRPRGGNDDLRGRDHPKVYVAWSKHAHFQTPLTRWVDPFSQLMKWAYRGEDWWYFPAEADYIRADASTELGAKLASFEWGSAASYPARVHEEMCEASQKKEDAVKEPWLGNVGDRPGQTTLGPTDDARQSTVGGGWQPSSEDQPLKDL